MAAMMLVPVAVTVHRLLAAELWNDEYYVLLARRMIVESGVPRLPSGVLYPYGGPALYLGAVGTWIGGLDVFWNRLPLALPALLAPLVVAGTGRRLHGPAAGVTAGAVLALHPGYLQWTASAGLYGVLTLLAALATDRWCAWVLEERASAGLAFGCWFALAALCSPVVAALLPGLLVAALLRRRTRRPPDVRHVAALALCAAGPVLILGIMALGDPTLVAHLPAADRPDAGLLHRIGSRGWRVLDGLARNLVASPWHATAASLALLGGAAALRAGGKGLRERLRSRAGDGLLLIFPVIVAVVLLSGFFRYRWERYLLPAVPLIALGTGRFLAAVGDRFADGRRGVVTVAAGLLVTVHVLACLPAIPAVIASGGGRAEVLAYLADHVEPGDLLLGGGVPAALHAGPGVTRHQVWSANFDLNAHDVDGRPHDRFLGDRFLADPAELQEAFSAAPRVWYLVSDEELDRGRVSQETHRWICERTQAVLSGGGSHLRRR